MSKILDVALDITKATVDITQSTVQTSIMLPIQAVNYSMGLLGVYNVMFDAVKNSLLSYALYNPYEKNNKTVECNAAFMFTNLFLFPTEKIRQIMIHQNYILNNKSIAIFTGFYDCFFKEFRARESTFSFIKNCYRGGFYNLIFRTIYFNLIDFRTQSLYNSLVEIKKNSPSSKIEEKNKVIKYWKSFKTKVTGKGNSILDNTDMDFKNQIFYKIIFILKDFLILDVFLYSSTFLFERFSILKIVSNRRYSIENTQVNYSYNFFRFNGFIPGLYSVIFKHILLIPFVFYITKSKIDIYSLIYSLAYLSVVDFIVYPLKQIKYRMMTKELTHDCYDRIIPSFKTIINNENLSGLFRGYKVRMIQGILYKLSLYNMFNYIDLDIQNV